MERGLRMMKKSGIRRRAEYTRQVVSKKLRKLHSEKLDNVCSSPKLIGPR
jgi:hypothetical protein